MSLTFPDLLRKSPFVRLAVPLLLGIACGEYGLSLPFSAIYVVAALLFVYLFGLTILRKNIYSRRHRLGVPIFAILFFSGLALWQQQKRESEMPVNKDLLLSAVIIENPVQKPSSVQLRVRLDGYKDSLWHGCNEKSILYVSADSLSPKLQAGQRLLVSTSLQAIKAPSNPEEFDYRRYMQHQGYYTTAFVGSHDYVIADSIALSSLQMLPLKAQQNLLHSFRQAGIEGQELAVLLALTIGDKQLLDDDVKAAYTSAGVIHVLAVSGMHVGLLYLLLSTMLFFLKGNRFGRVLRIVLIFLILWIFAAIAGFSPSVVRAVVMFSFVLLGQLANREASTINSIAASAFFICLFSPLSLFDVGFQLSYLAIIGIIGFYPKLAKLVTINNLILRGTYKLCCMSLAAQLAVLPLSVYYFHQLPLYFLVANLLVIPLVTIASYLIVVLLFVSWIPLLSGLVSGALNACLQLTTYVVSAVQQLPFSVWDGIYISPLQLALYMLALVTLLLLMVVRKRALVWTAVACVMLGFSLSIAHRMETANQRQLAVLDVGKASFLLFVEGHDALCLRDAGSIDKRVDYKVGGYFTRLGLADEQVKTIPHDSISLIKPIGEPAQYKGFLWFHGCSIKLLTSAKDVVAATSPVAVDMLVVTSAFKPMPTEALACYLPRKVILDSSLSKWRAERWLEVLQAENIPCHNVKEQGAFILEL